MRAGAAVDGIRGVQHDGAGVVSALRPRPETPLVDAAEPAVDTQVALIVTDTVEEATLRLLREIKQTELSDREVDVLRCLASGLDTAETTQKVGYAERTVKNVIHGLQTPPQLKNRAYRVACAATSDRPRPTAAPVVQHKGVTGAPATRPSSPPSRQPRRAGRLARDLPPPSRRRRMSHVRERLLRARHRLGHPAPPR